MSDRPLSTIRPISRVGIRSDDSGDGKYLASRKAPKPNDPAARRPHEGIDLVAPAGDPVVSPFDGIVDISGAYKDPAKSEYKIVTVTSGNQRYRYFYVSPEGHDGTSFVRDGDQIAAGQQIGIVQDIAKSDSDKKMINHVHFAISEGTKGKEIYIDPTPQVTEWQRD